MTLVLDTSYTLPNVGIEVRNLPVLWLPGQQTGKDVDLAGVNGSLARPRFLTSTVRTLELVVYGRGPITGSGATAAECLELNIEWLRDLVYPVSSSDGTRDAVLTLPSGATLEGPVHLLGLSFGQVAPHGKWALATMDVNIPGGELARVEVAP